MATGKVNAPKEVIERNIRLTGEIMRFLMDHPQAFDALPDKFELVILPEDEPQMRLYNLDLLDKYGSEGKPIVFARIRTRPGSSVTPTSLNLFAPIPVAV